MGYNPQRKAPPPKQLFSASLFRDVYLGIEKEYGAEWTHKHLAAATLYLDDAGKGELQLSGAGANMQALVGMLICRLAQEYATAELAQAKKQGKTLTVNLKQVAKQILDNAWKKIQTLDNFEEIA